MKQQPTSDYLKMATDCNARGWWSHHQCFTMFRIRSVVKDTTTASRELSSLGIEKQVGRRGWKAWSEGRRGRKSWPEGVVRKLALGFKPIRLNLAIPWCAKSQKFKMLHSPRCPLDTLKKFQIPLGFSRRSNQVHLSSRIHKPLMKLLEAHSICCVLSFRRSQTRRITEVFSNGVLQKGTIRTPATVI